IKCYQFKMNMERLLMFFAAAAVMIIGCSKTTPQPTSPETEPNPEGPKVNPVEEYESRYSIDIQDKYNVEKVYVHGIRKYITDSGETDSLITINGIRNKQHWTALFDYGTK